MSTASQELGERFEQHLFIAAPPSAVFDCFFSAEALLATRLPDETACLVLDVRLPGLTGFELYERIVAKRKSYPVIFVTANDNQADRAR